MSPPPIVLVKLGGSLITDKKRIATARPGTLQRLAGEIAASSRKRVVLGHGSGSFGHVAARRHRIADGIEEPAQLAGLVETQRQAAKLHRRVVDALAEAGALPYSIAPSSALSARRRRLGAFHAPPLLRALELGLLPVVYGDVVLDAEQGAAIASTEAVLTAAAKLLLRQGHAVREALWLGETAGVLDAKGRTIPRIRPGDLPGLIGNLTGASGVDVTGGIRLRVESALNLAKMGIPSRIFDGREEGALARALAGRAVPATRVSA